MAELMIVRHAQASFGTDDYDRLSELGRRQSAIAGAFLRDRGWEPDRVITGSLNRQQETLTEMGIEQTAEVHPGFNEYDFDNLLSVRFGGEIPDDVRTDRKTHFRTLRDTLLEWQDGGLTGASETWAEFVARTDAARTFATDGQARRVLVISSGGAIGQVVARVLDAPSPQMIALNLQIKNTSMTRFFFSGPKVSLHEFNSTPHFETPEGAGLLSYS